ncbi:MAG: lytic murein transglycosylase B [Chromatiales bacterium]|jgi:membrane-bound lytic murein transglycosylase B|nr:lytic murein transglycosylase B [Chromatiales bacterium]
MIRIRPLLARLAVGAITASTATACASAPPYTDERPEVREFISTMTSKHAFTADELKTVFREVNYRQDIIDAMTKPAEKRPWSEYRPRFLTPDRIRGGVEFWKENEEILARAEQTYGVPPQIVTAIIGVETFYGRSTGRHRVVDALATLAFDYPPRADFFRGELEQYLMLTREEHFDPLTLTGSYAGAMGKPQFIPSSYRRYAVDFDGDGRRDLFNNVADVIGSVANYLGTQGWKKDEAVVAPATVTSEDYLALLALGIEPRTPVSELPARGVLAGETLAPETPVALIELDGEKGKEYWVGLRNFYVITRYNRSSLYAMAVTQLAQEIAAQYRAPIKAKAP